MSIEEINGKISELDTQLVDIFRKRMELCGQLALEKQAGRIPLADPAAERTTMAQVAQQAGSDMSNYAQVLYSTVLDLADGYEQRLTGHVSDLPDRINAALNKTDKMFPESALVACQGVEGAYSQQAATKLFTHPQIMYFSNFEGVFAAIDKGLCRYGVLPLENSTAGSVNAIYDLMMKYNFSIVRSMRLKVDHSVIVKPGTKLSDIKEIFSHEQAINQCASFIKSLGNVKVTVVENTAMAAKRVAESDRSDIAALSSIICANLYGLESIAASVQDKGNNYTRFICISKELEIYPGADRTSVMLTIPHRPGSLYRVIAKINALEVNLTKLESRPIPDRDFQFMFYFDLDASVYSPRFSELMGRLDGMCESFRYLGSYSEIV